MTGVHPLTGTAPIIAFNFNHHYLGTLPALVVLLSAWLGMWLSQPELFGTTAEIQHGSLEVQPGHV